MTSREPFVSIVIPFYSNKTWLEEAINSVEKQTFRNYEIVIVNDGSREDISDLVRRCTNCIYLSQPNQGPAIARNRGIERARGDYIAFLDSDDLWTENKLETQINFMEQTNALWTYTDYSIFTSNQFTLRFKFHPIEGIIFPRCLISNPIATPTVMIRAEILRKNPSLRFPSDMRHGQDGFMWALLGKEIPVKHIPICLAKVRLHGNNSAKRAVVQMAVKAAFWKKIKAIRFYAIKSMKFLAMK